MAVLDKREQVVAVKVPLDHVHRFVGDEQQVEVPRDEMVATVKRMLGLGL